MDAVTAETPSPDTLTVDLGTETGPFHGGASGTLYGLYGDGVPSRTLVEGMYVRTVTTKAQDGIQHPGGDALEILPPFVAAGGRDVYVYLPDFYRGFPYEWPGSTGEERLAGFLEVVRRQVEHVLTLGPDRTPVVYVPFNEPEGNMFGEGEWSHDGISWRTDPRHYFEAWKAAYHLIKGLDPDARVAGPNTSILYPEVRGFLEFAKAHDVLPDVITWHELSSPAEVRTNVAKYREMERELGIGPLPVNLNEYAHNYHVSVPGQMVQWISAIEESKVDADLAYWNIAGNLNDSAVEANKANGQWWLFNAYGQLTGNTVQVAAPRPNVQYTLQGVAALDRDKRQARLLFGGAAGAADIVFEGVDPDVFGATVHVRLQEIPWTGQVGAGAQPLRLRDEELPVGEGRVTLSVSDLDAMSAYQVVLSPGGNGARLLPASVAWRRTYEAEDATYTGGGYAKNGPEGSPSDVDRFATSGGYHVGGLRTGSDGVLAFDVEVPRDGTYEVSVFANSYNQADLVREFGPTNVFLRVDGEAPRELRLPLGYKWAVWGHTDTRVELSAGRHRITLAAQDPDLGVTKGDAVVDKVDLILRDDDGTAVYEAEYASLDGGAVVSHAHRGASGPGAAVLPREGTVTFWVHAADDGEASVNVDVLGPGEGLLAVNGEPVGPVVRGAMPLFLAGGVNKLTVTGTSQLLVVDRLRVGPSHDLLPSTAYPAEEGALTGSAKVTGYPYATGGKAVEGIGGGPGNALTLTVTATRAGRHALTIRYANGEQAPATHYNPDPVCRHADVSVNGAAPHRVLFPTTFHFNNFWNLSVPVTLEEGTNTLTLTADELPDFDGKSRNRYGQRSAYAPVVDQVTVTPLS
ncbi:cellulosome protein [Streptomyces resistomycificus]|uniref:Cellulosome protein n=1 Tax=Streptomyces resistomycificus TaxID=67356 RepID=A0A0L8LNK2_9ACTN|nr:cellulosome protein [Streptomyces resistomycificus]KOG39788.1 cellulosome protein [Streptomyces resistomycificus]KUO00829.1 cellulosome protein [Streptomyces resistomycificus]